MVASMEILGIILAGFGAVGAISTAIFQKYMKLRNAAHRSEPDKVAKSKRVMSAQSDRKAPFITPPRDRPIRSEAGYQTANFYSALLRTGVVDKHFAEVTVQDVVPNRKPLRLPIIDKAPQSYERKQIELLYPNEAAQLEGGEDTKYKEKPTQSVPEMMSVGKRSYEPNSAIIILDRHRKNARGRAGQYSDRKWERT